MAAGTKANRTKRAAKPTGQTEQITPLDDMEVPSDPDASGKHRHRLQIDFSPEAYERLMRIRERSEAATNAEVVRNALRLYDWFLDQRTRNSRLQMVEGDTVKEIEVLF